MMITCPCCAGKGQIREGAPVFLPQSQLRIYNMVRSSPYGLSAHAISERLYGSRDDPPNHPIQTIWGLVQAANRRLAGANQTIISTGGPGSHYKLETIKPTSGGVKRDANR